MARFNLSSFLKLSPEEQAKQIEKETKALLKKLPELKKNLKMYNEVSDELYNLTSEEVSLMGETYSKAVRNNEITTTSSKQAYQQFINNLNKYARTDISQLAQQTAELRMESWLNHIKEASFDADKDYASRMVENMSDEEKLGFTRSKYFMDSSYMYEVVDINGDKYSIQTLKLELYLKEVRAKMFDDIYDTYVRKKEK